jgi:biopolymer transport protein ExbD
MGMSAGGGKGAKSDINVTPLVDVCLVLLIIFMVMVPRNVPEISVRVPPETKQKNPKPPDEEPLVIEISADGALALNQKQMGAAEAQPDREKLGKELERQFGFRDKRVVFVDFDDKVAYGVAVAVLDTAKAAGAEVLGIRKHKDQETPDTLKPG